MTPSPIGYALGVKYAVVIISGAGDEPLAELAQRTPLQAAHMPRLKALAERGRVGALATVPAGFDPTTETCLLTLLGHDPLQTSCGRAPFEAAALGIATGDAFVFRFDLVSIGEEGSSRAGLMLDHTAGQIPTAEANVLRTDLMSFWKRESADLVRSLSVTPGPGHRALAVDCSGRDYTDVVTVAPRDVLGLDAGAHLPAGGVPGSSDALRQLIESSHDFLRTHEVNLARAEQGLCPGNLAWFWAHGRMPELATLEDRFKLRGAIIGSDPVLRGIARLAGWEIASVPDDRDRAGVARAACALIDEYDIVLVCDEAPDQASHTGDWEAKTEALEQIDAELIGPILDKLASFGDAERDAGAVGWRAMVAVDHPTHVRTRQHGSGPSPVAMGGAWIRSAVQRTFSESQAEQSDLYVDPGHELLEFFLKGGLADVRKDASR